MIAETRTLLDPTLPPAAAERAPGTREQRISDAVLAAYIQDIATDREADATRRPEVVRS